eukprot:GHRQ01023479.1.p1 GENE.GHRQ01023479.1~~GHRQ01023479.1.p1  ORF type:complete len:205 (-),score=70.23 GHRQ01023479.1:248-862(-)
MKGVIAAGISIALFKNPVTAKGMLGYFITVMGVVAYSEVSPRQLAGKLASPTIKLGCMHASSWNSAIACASSAISAQQLPAGPKLRHQLACTWRRTVPHSVLLPPLLTCIALQPPLCVSLQTKRRSKLRQSHETGKGSSMDDMASKPLLSKTSDAGGSKDHMLPVSHDWAPLSRKASSNGEGKQDFAPLYKTIVLKATAGDHTS